MLKKLILILSLVVFSPNASAVENGQIANGDENAIYLLDGSPNGFLYKPQIVFTIAHSSEQWSAQPLFVTTSSGKKVKVDKVLVSKDFKDRTQSMASRHSDFSILILSEPIEMKNKVELIKPEEVNDIILNNIEVRMTGYSYYDSSRVRDGIARTLISKMISKKDAESIFTKYYSVGHENWALKGSQFELQDMNVSESISGGSGCDGDSGSGFYIVRNSTKVYLGPNGSHSVGTPNCGKPGYFGEYGNATAIEPVYNHMDLINEAEKIVESMNSILIKPTPIPSTKTVSKSKVKITIKCTKGTRVMYATSYNPVCPKGYQKSQI